LLLLDYYRRASVEDVCNAAEDIIEGNGAEAPALVSEQTEAEEGDRLPSSPSKEDAK
jgi:hypothetical protein